nr:NADH dehydrogenase subunit 3 [Hecalus sp.]
MMLMIYLTIMIVIILMIMTLMIVTISKKSIIDKEKATPFECGFNSMSHSRLPFSIHFFLIAVIFLIFDIEIIMIMPIIMTMKTSMLKFWMMTSTIFIMILLIGLMHEWKNGMMEWTS